MQALHQLIGATMNVAVLVLPHLTSQLLGGGHTRGIKIPQQDFTLKMQVGGGGGGLCMRGVYLQDTKVLYNH